MAAAAVPLHTEVAPLVLTQIEEERVRDYFTKLVAKTATGAATHPLTLAKTLFQLGHEPYSLSSGKLYYFFGREAYFLPNAFQYLKNLYNEAGFTTLFTGLDAAILSSITGGAASFALELYLDRYFPDVGGAYQETKKEEEELTDHESFRLKLRQAIRASIFTSVGLIASRPLTVVMIREIAQLVGHETKYASVIGALYTIGYEEGPRGFFSGLVPALIAQGITIWGTFAFTYVIERALVRGLRDKNEDENGRKAIKDARKVFNVVIPFFVNSFSYPFGVVSTLMSVSGSGLAISLLPYSPAFSHWGDLYDYLKPHGLLRGARLFLREQKGAVSVGANHHLYARYRY
uniref:Mitochondrial carrier protein n=1 Tax=Panagrolaimus sp. ES5 TaxID=591445 RepID=A0AC34F4B5_9BILA